MAIFILGVNKIIHILSGHLSVFVIVKWSNGYSWLTVMWEIREDFCRSEFLNPNVGL